jgi:hypothetical protein
VKRTIADGVNQGQFALAGKTGDVYDPVYFKPETGLVDADVEFSDDMILVKPDRAKSLIQPPRMERVEVRPAVLRLKPSATGTFTVACFDQHGRDFPCSGTTWSASGGAIDADGRFTSGLERVFTVRATVAGIEGTAAVQVTKDPIIVPPLVKRIAWRGSVPPQKWMNLYTKVLSRFSTTPGLKLELSFEVPASDAVTDSKREEVQAALCEVVLGDLMDQS